VYCLNAETGRLAWRFRVAPIDRRIVAYGQLESVWPVHGSVLVKDDKVYCSAGRSSLLDGGITFHALDPLTGRILVQNVIHHPYDVAEPLMLGNDGRNFDGNLAVLQDLLVGDGEGLALKQLRLDANCVPVGKTVGIIANNGLLNSSWFSRIGWFFGKPTQEVRKSNANRANYDIFKSGRQGQYLIFDDATTYSVRVHPNLGKFSQSFIPGEEGYRVFADHNDSFVNKWNIFTPIRVEAMVGTGNNTLYMAGAPDIVDETDAWGAIEGRMGGLLWAVSTDTGRRLAKWTMDSPPVFDGMIAAYGKLFIALKNGTLVCLGDPPAGRKRNAAETEPGRS
jgi:outer membrane protein assembly factor BamB